MASLLPLPVLVAEPSLLLNGLFVLLLHFFFSHNTAPEPGTILPFAMHAATDRTAAAAAAGSGACQIRPFGVVQHALQGLLLCSKRFVTVNHWLVGYALLLVATCSIHPCCRRGLAHILPRAVQLTWIALPSR
jgi:hypothetical protein